MKVIDQNKPHRTCHRRHHGYTIGAALTYVIQLSAQSSNVTRLIPRIGETRGVIAFITSLATTGRVE